MKALSQAQMLTMLRYYAEGNRAGDIADIEYLSIHAVNNRLKRVKAVMNCNTTTQAVVQAIADGDLIVTKDSHGEVSVRLGDHIEQ